MSKQIALGCIIILIIIIPATIGFPNQTDSVHKWYVDITNTQGPWTGNKIYPFSQIQTAIQHANPGDVILIFNGTYRETVKIDKPLIIRNMTAQQPIIDGGYHDSIITINHPHVNLSGLILRNSSGSKRSCAIRCESSAISISHCKFYRTRTGILVQNTDHITISTILQKYSFKIAMQR
jgi:nitrous oxidase accessory protein NosD